MNNDKSVRKTAGNILDTAKKTVTQDRGNSHGGAEDSFAMIGDLWQTYLRHSTNYRMGSTVGSIHNLDVTPFDVAQMMVLLKIARSVFGDPSHLDHYVDAAGYSSLAGSLAPTPPQVSGSVSATTTNTQRKVDPYDPLSAELAGTLAKGLK